MMKTCRSESHLKVDYTKLHCYKHHKDEWFEKFIQRVEMSERKREENITLQREEKVASYNFNREQNLAFLRGIEEDKVRDMHKRYMRPTVNSIAKTIR